MTLDAFIKDYRVKHNLIQQEFADKAGISKATVIRIEKGHGNHQLKPKLIRKIAAATGRGELYIASLIK